MLYYNITRRNPFDSIGWIKRKHPREYIIIDYRASLHFPSLSFHRNFTKWSIWRWNFVWKWREADQVRVPRHGKRSFRARFGISRSYLTGKAISIVHEWVSDNFAVGTQNSCLKVLPYSGSFPETCLRPYKKLYGEYSVIVAIFNFISFHFISFAYKDSCAVIIEIYSSIANIRSWLFIHIRI